MKKIVCVIVAAVFAASLLACGKSGNSDGYTEPEYTAYTVSQKNTVLGLQSTDALGRYFGAEGEFDPNKKVGIFYFIWSGHHGEGCVWDSSFLTEDVLKNDGSTLDVYHYWYKPLYDYYNSEDPWVFRKHLELLSMAGIDYLVFDVSNSYIYKNVCDKLLPVAAEIAASGWEIPKFIFYCNKATKDTVTSIYEWFYDPANPELRKYDCLWYCEEDNGERNSERKPWILMKNNGLATDPDPKMSAAQNYGECSDAIKNFFYTRELRWNAEHGADNEWLFPSDIDDPIVHKGMLSVSTAQHTSGAFSDSVFEPNSRDINRGRGWVWQNGERTSGTNVASNVALGTNYQSEWEYAFGLGDEVNNVFITGWNEWVAKKLPRGANGRSTYYFVDQFTPEFSRDVEMTAGLWGDNYYLQTVNMLRRFKSTGRKNEFIPRQAEIDIASADGWEGTVGYSDPAFDTTKRNYRSANYGNNGNVPNTVYVNDTGRNNIVRTNVTCDNRNLYFRIECANDITEYGAGDKSWMNILIEIDGVKGSNWENYQFVVNRTVSGARTSVERLKSDGSSAEIGAGSLHRDGKYLTVAIPRKLVELDGKEHFTMNFKVADNVTNYKDIMDYYVNGDSAPIGRLNYTFAL